MRGFFKLAFGISVISLVAFSAPGCGDDDDGGGGSGATGGTTGDAGVTCGTNTCETWKVGGLIPAGACCPTEAPEQCGADISATVGGLISFPAGCYELEQAGELDCGCPSKFFKSPIDGSDSIFNGCCTTTGECGLYVNLSNEGTMHADKTGPHLGCTPLTKLGQPKVTCTPGSETPPPPNPEAGKNPYCPNPDADGGTDGGGGTGGSAGASGDAAAD